MACGVDHEAFEALASLLMAGFEPLDDALFEALGALLHELVGLLIELLLGPLFELFVDLLAALDDGLDLEPLGLEDVALVVGDLKGELALFVALPACALHDLFEDGGELFAGDQRQGVDLKCREVFGGDDVLDADAVWFAHR